MSYSTFNSDSSTFETSSLQPQQAPQQAQQQAPQQIQENNTSNNQKITFHEKIKSFLVSKSGTIITAAFGMALGFALKDFVSSIVVNLLKPLIALIFTMTHLNNYYDFNSIISSENNAVNFSDFITSFITFLMVVISVYFISLNYQ
jgi:large-conductance mechanosensitive channel